jgi:putative transcriptional regulator
MTSCLDTAMRNEIRALRTGRQLSQQQLADAMDVSRQTINSIEKERYTPSLPLAMALARHFEMTVEEVFHADDNHAQPSPPRSR